MSHGPAPSRLPDAEQSVSATWPTPFNRLAAFSKRWSLYRMSVNRVETPRPYRLICAMAAIGTIASNILTHEDIHESKKR